MTKKGFDYEECYITFEGEVFAIAENKKNAKVIGETLTQLFNENEQLKSTIDEMIKIFQDSGLDYVVSEEVEEILE